MAKAKGSKRKKELLTRTEEEVSEVRAQFKKELRHTEEELRKRLRNPRLPRGDEPQVVITV